MSYNKYFIKDCNIFLLLETSCRPNHTLNLCSFEQSQWSFRIQGWFNSIDCLANCSAALAFTFLLRASTEHDVITSKNTLVKSAFINIFTSEMAEASSQRLKYWQIKHILTHGKIPHTFNNTCQLIFQLASRVFYKSNACNLGNTPIMKKCLECQYISRRGRWIAYQLRSHRSAEAI